MSDTSKPDVAYVRTEMLPEQDPPVTAAGPVKWLKENLFSNVPNTILTLVAAYFLYLLFKGSMPWFLNGIWDASSIRECREIMDGSVGGCFAVLTDRWDQLLFGFQYPPELYWRVLMAFVLLFVAIAPVLFYKLFPAQMFYFTGLYPFIA